MYSPNHDPDMTLPVFHWRSENGEQEEKQRFESAASAMGQTPGNGR